MAHHAWSPVERFLEVFEIFETLQLARVQSGCYTTSVNTEQIKLRLRGGGFRPFVLHLSDGRQFRIEHPEFILVGRGVVVVLREDDLVETLDALHVVSVEDLKTGTASRES